MNSHEQMRIAQLEATVKHLSEQLCFVGDAVGKMAGHVDTLAGIVQRHTDRIERVKDLADKHEKHLFPEPRTPEEAREEAKRRYHIASIVCGDPEVTRKELERLDDGPEDGGRPEPHHANGADPEQSSS